LCFSLLFCRIGWARPGIGKRFQPKDPIENLKTSQIHVSFISKQVDALVSEATLRSLFSSCGEVVDVTIKKSHFDQVILLSFLRLRFTITPVFRISGFKMVMVLFIIV
jgi:hypothetical protein